MDPQSPRSRTTAEARRFTEDLARIGQVLADRYELVQILGRGGMGTVYKAKQLQMDRIVAIKVLQSDLAEDPLATSRFLREAKSASKISHPNVVQLIDFGNASDGAPFLVMEYLQGQTLDEAISSNRQLSFARALPIFQQVCEALHAAHSRGIIHRDLKPGNIMLVEENGVADIVKVVDFGLAKAANTGDESQRLTQTGEVFGSPVYMSPEQCLGRQIDPRSDVYALGIVMYETLTGRLPLSGNNVAETIAKHLTETAEPFRVIRPDLTLPSHIEQIIFQAMSKEAGERQSSMIEVRDQLTGDASIPSLRKNGSRSLARDGSDKQEYDNSGKSKTIPIAIALSLTGLLSVAGLAATGMFIFQSIKQSDKSNEALQIHNSPAKTLSTPPQKKIEAANSQQERDSELKKKNDSEIKLRAELARMKAEQAEAIKKLEEKRKKLEQMRVLAVGKKEKKRTVTQALSESANDSSSSSAEHLQAQSVQSNSAPTHRRRRDWHDYSYGVEKKESYTHTWDVPVAGTGTR